MDNGEKASSVFAVMQTHIGPQPVGQCPDNGEAKAAAFGPAAARNTVKAFEHPRPVGSRNAGAFIFDLQSPAALVRP